MQNKGSLHNKFNNYGANPSSAVWQNIENSLNKKRKKKILFFWWLGGAVLLVFTLLMANQLFNIKVNSPISKLNHTKIIKTINSNTVKKNKFKNAPKIQSKNIFKNQVSQTRNVLRSNINQSFGKPLTTKIKSTNNTKPNGQKENFTNNIIKKIKVKTKLLKTEKRKFNFNSIITKNSKKISWHYGYNIETAKPIFTTQNTPITNFSNFDTNSENIQNILLKPISLQFNFGINIKNRIAINSGINFGILRAYEANLKSTFFSLGLPFDVQYHFIKKRKFTLYSSLGLINQIPLISHISNANVKNTIFTKGFNFIGGIKGGVGFGYNYNENLRLTVLPNLHYYYLQKTNLDYKLPSFNVDFQFGMVWHY